VIKFSARARLLAVAVTILMAGTCAIAVGEKAIHKNDIVGHEITLKDGRHGRVLHLLNGEAAVETTGADGKAEVAYIPWTTSYELAGMSRGKIGLILSK
jgi:hypothetical protein